MYSSLAIFIVSPSPYGSTALTSIPYVNLSSMVSGQLDIANGGTGISTAPTAGSLLIGTSSGGYASNTITAGSGITVTNSSGGITISTSGASGVSSFNGRTGTVTPISSDYSSYYYPLSGNPSNFVTSSSLTNFVSLTAANTMTGSGSITATGTSIGDQRLGVQYGGYSSGLSAQSIQLGTGGYGVLYTPAGSSFDAYAGVGFIAGSGGANFVVSHDPALTLYAGAYTCYKGGSSTSWVIYTSDARSKENITPYTKGLTELKQINPKNWEYNGLAGTVAGEKGTGLVAQEIYEVVPSMRVTRQGKLHPDDKELTDIYTVDTSEMTWILTNAVKELSAKVDAQAAEIAALKAKL
ncbi:MAG: tail fiber domain-containing protein [Methylococcales bacterium]